MFTMQVYYGVGGFVWQNRRLVVIVRRPVKNIRSEKAENVNFE